MANLEGRISQQADPLPYTYLNTVLVAVNPLKVLKNQPHFNDYVDCSFDPEKPHPYAIAEVAPPPHPPTGWHEPNIYNGPGFSCEYAPLPPSCIRTLSIVVQFDRARNRLDPPLCACLHSSLIRTCGCRGNRSRARSPS